MVVRRRGASVGLIHLPVSLKTPGTSSDCYEAVFLVDTGAIDSMAPSSALRRVGIQPVGRETFELVDGSQHEYEFGIAQIEFLGAITAGRVIFGPDGIAPLLGVTALESAGVTVDPRTQTLKKLPLRL
jgi:clan AA aspartic protease